MRKVIWLLLAFPILIFSCPADSATQEDLEEGLLGTIERVEVEYFFDDVTFRLTNKNPPSVEDISGVEHHVEITSIAGTTEQIATHFVSDFNEVEILGKTLYGTMFIHFFPRSKTVNIDIWQRRKFSSFVLGNVNQLFSIDANAIRHSNTYTDDFTGLEVEEYTLTGENACKAGVAVEYDEDNDQFKEKLTRLGCKERAFIKVKVHYK